MMEDYKEFTSDEVFSLLKSKKSRDWIDEGHQRSLKLFHAAAKRVPAYGDFLRKNGIAASKVKTWADFEQLPSVDKKNYLREYSLEDLCWDGTLEKAMIITSTSGSTGKPFYFPREPQLDWQLSIIIKSFLESSSYKRKGPVLVINGFSMGVWIGGLITYNAFEIAAVEGEYPVSIITPGINKEQIIAALKDLSPSYSQTVLIGYPPFIKDIIDVAGEEGVDLKALNLRILFAAEAFGETFRDYLVEKCGIQNPYQDTMNIYGSADIGAMASETPLSILARREALSDDDLFADFFSGIKKVPTFAQFNPLFIFFEAVEGNLLLTGDNAIPLIRYSIGDQGGVMDYDGMVSLFKTHGIEMVNKITEAGISDVVSEMPFVYLYERSDLVCTLFGLQIYPEHIREALLEPAFQKKITGKFTMETKFDEAHNQYLEINIELKPGQMDNNELNGKILKKVIATFIEMNSEFKELYSYLKERAEPKLVYWPHGHPKYFKSGVKQKWVIKE
ncbi:phenylacetate--CoA ligase family protein [Patescibacteria group bacterium]